MSDEKRGRGRPSYPDVTNLQRKFKIEGADNFGKVKRVKGGWVLEVGGTEENEGKPYTSRKKALDRAAEVFGEFKQK